MSTRTLISEQIADLQLNGLNFGQGVQCTWGGPFTNTADAAASVIALKTRGSLVQNFYCEGTGGVGIPAVLFKHDIDSTGIAVSAQGNSGFNGISLSTQGTGSNMYLIPTYPTSVIKGHSAATGAWLKFQSPNSSGTYLDTLSVRGSTGADTKVSVSIGDGNTASPALGIQAKIGIGLSTDVPGTYYGVWIGNTANASQNTTTYNLLGDDTGSTWLSSPASGGNLTFSNANVNKLQIAGSTVTLINTKLVLPQATVTGGGSQTVNQPCGIVNFNTSVSSGTITCSYCTTSSVVLTMMSAAVAVAVTPGSGSFAYAFSAAVGSGQSMRFVVVN